MASEQLALLLLKTGRNREASTYIQTLLNRREMFSFQSLVLFAADPDQVIDQGMLEKWQQHSPDDASPLLGLAKIEYSRRQPQAALDLLERVIAADPNETEAHFAKGRIILTTSPELLPNQNQSVAVTRAAVKNLPTRRASFEVALLLRAEGSTESS